MHLKNNLSKGSELIFVPIRKLPRVHSTEESWVFQGQLVGWFIVLTLVFILPVTKQPVGGRRRLCCVKGNKTKEVRRHQRYRKKNKKTIWIKLSILFGFFCVVYLVIYLRTRFGVLIPDLRREAAAFNKILLSAFLDCFPPLWTGCLWLLSRKLLRSK